jgi:hypothetical protein
MRAEKQDEQHDGVDRHDVAVTRCASQSRRP